MQTIGAMIGGLTAFIASCRVPTPIPPAGGDLLYILQPEPFSAAQLASPSFEWLVLEPSRDGRRSGDIPTSEIAEIRAGAGCRKTVLAYLSIGEAENYRDYWNAAWVDAAGTPIPGVAPSWLGPENPDFPGNYKVRYWDPAWQALLWGDAAAGSTRPLDRILSQGFDGVYLDIIDAYDFWSADAGERTREQARRDMIALVDAIATYARVTRGDGDFLVFPQNGSDIIRNDAYELDAQTDRYFAAISGIGQEDLFYDELSPQPTDESAFVLEQLREYESRGKAVLVTDYVIDRANPASAGNNERARDFHARCRAEGFIPYAAYSDRALDVVVTLNASVNEVAQPSSECGTPN